jgi:hypothetical protein
MVAVGTSRYSNIIFSRFLYTQTSIITDNIFADITDLELTFKGIMIKN